MTGGPCEDSMATEWPMEEMHCSFPGALHWKARHWSAFQLSADSV